MNNYTETYISIQDLKEMAENLDDSELVGEIHEISYEDEDSNIGDILHSYWMGFGLDKEQREALEWLYTLAWFE